MADSVDTLVVGAGPAGSAAAIWAARGGHTVTLVDRAQFPRDKCCGDGLTPRAIAELDALGGGDWIRTQRCQTGVALAMFGRTYAMPWPGGAFPALSAVVPRTVLDHWLVRCAVDSGATMLSKARVTDVILTDGRIAAVEVQEGSIRRRIGCRTVIVADGAGSPVGSLLGRRWRRDKMYAVAARSYMESPLGDGDVMTVTFGDALTGALVTGYGWLFPTGDGLANVGYGQIVTDKLPLPAASRAMHDRFIGEMRDRWQLRGAPLNYAAAPLSIGGMVTGVAGPNWMLVGDAACGTNPVTGEGIDFALESGRMAAELLGAVDDFTAAWPRRLTRAYGHSLAGERKITRLISEHPRLAGRLVPLLMSSGRRGRFVLRTATNLIGQHDRDVTARIHGSVNAIAQRSEHPMFL
nr:MULTISPECIES: NAD(P)/FAD-dependent oxidoreductase [unclassified Mycobacterium]